MTALPLTHHEPRPDSQPENHTRARQRSDRRIAWGLGLALFGLIILVWNPTFHSSDGLSMYLVADSLVRHGGFDTEQIRWMGLQQGMFGPDGLLYSNKGLATSLLMLPLTWAGLTLPGLGPVIRTGSPSWRPFPFRSAASACGKTWGCCCSGAWVWRPLRRWR